MIAPLRTGDKICLVAPGRKVSSVDMDEAITVFKNWGFEVALGKNLFGNNHSYLSGSDQERRADFQIALDDPSIKQLFVPAEVTAVVGLWISWISLILKIIQSGL